MPETPKKFYLTTPIYYVNARPHIGHAYSTIAADVIARRHRLLGDDTFFLTGTDEHGQKVQRSAAAAGVPPQQFTDEVSATFQNLWKRMGITNDDYIRTTDERHKRGVQKLWKHLEDRGAIYLSTYTGQYSVGEEMFVEGPPGTIGPDGKPTETVTEENYFFRLSDYQQPLIDLIESGALHVQPETTKNEVLSFLRGGIRDLSISRTTFDWGIPVPSNEKHVVYVWLDALANYITAIGYGSDDPADIAKFERYWPADLHLVGKEITRFHCVYWPAFLMAAGLPLPKSVVANGWLLFEESKMSKSRGNVVRTETILDAFGPLCPNVPLEPSTNAIISATNTVIPATNAVILSGARSAQSKDPEAAGPADSTQTISATEPALAAPTKAQQDLFAADVLRYFLLREIPFGQDGSFSFDALITRYNADLANGYGNLVSRTLKLIEQNLPDGFGETYSGTFFCGEFEEDRPALLGDDALEWYVGSAENLSERGLVGVQSLESVLGNALTSYSFSKALRKVWNFIGIVDLHISNEAPWKLAKSPDPNDIQKLKEILYTAAESIRIITALLYPVMPYATASVWRQLGLGSIEQAAQNGELKNLTWGGLKPGTKLGPLAPIFPRADKGLAQIMTEMESPTPTPQTPESVKSVVGSTPTHTPERSVQSVSSVLSSPPTEATETTPQITIDDFAKVDLRVAQIVVAERIPKADKLLRLEVDLGYERRQILAGIAEYYAPETLIGRKVVIVANLAPRKMRGLESQGMIVAASLGPAGAPVLAGFLEDVELGARLK
jgi:methionyl-tRNA synthetase